MQNLWPLLIVLACPVMMIFMMRGMHGGHDTTHTASHNDTATGDDRAEARIAELEREVAELRSEPKPTPTPALIRLSKPASKS